mgnify:CR=1 FL=1
MGVEQLLFTENMIDEEQELLRYSLKETERPIFNEFSAKIK